MFRRDGSCQARPRNKPHRITWPVAGTISRPGESSFQPLVPAHWSLRYVRAVALLATTGEARTASPQPCGGKEMRWRLT